MTQQDPKPTLSQAGILANINYYSALVKRAEEELHFHMRSLQEQLEALQKLG